MKKLLSIIIAFGIVCTNIGAFAKDVTVLYNNKEIEFDVKPFIENDRTLVPMRAIFETVGAEVSWEEDTKTVVASQNIDGELRFVVLQIGNQYAFINNQKVLLDVPGKIVGDRTVVPLRFVMEALNKEVSWDQDTYTATITD